MAYFRRRSGKMIAGPHITETEAGSLEQACDVLAVRQRAKAQSARLKGKFVKNYWIGLSRASTGLRRAKVLHEKIYGKKQKLSHPFHDLSDEDKRLKMISMYESGTWGTGIRGIRALAKRFNVTVGQAAIWLDGHHAPL